MKRKILAGILLVSLVALLSVSCTATPAPAPTPTPTPSPFPTQNTEPTPAPVNEEESLQVAIDFVTSSPTFEYDGIEDTLKLVDTLYPDVENSYEFVFQFECRQAGYGDRTGHVLAQVITPHEADITVESGEVVSALTDGQWDMIEQKFVEDNSETPPPPVPPVDNGTESVELQFTYDELMTEQHIAKDVEIELPGSLIVMLASNPSTGFQWQDAAISDNTVLSEYSRQYVEPQGDLVGAAGKDVWVFETHKEGTGTITFDYSRPWEGGEQGEWTVELNVIVK